MELEASKSIRRLNKLKNAELILRLNHSVLKSSDLQELQREFYYRFSKSFYKICLVVAENNAQSRDIAEEIFQETMCKAVCSVQRFTVNQEDSEEIIRKKVLGWLGTIANHELSNFFNRHTHEDRLDESLDDLQDLQDETEHEDIQIPISLERAKLSQAMDSLKERERYLINMCAINNCLNLDKDEAETHLPEKVLTEICTQLQIKRGALRVLKKRTIEKLLKRLNQL